MNRKRWTTGMLVLLLALSAGCGQKPEASPANSNGSAPVHNGVNAEDPGTTNSGGEAQPQEQTPSEDVTLTINSYYTDDQILDLIKSAVDIRFTDEKDKYMEALQTLTNSSDSGLFALWEKAVFHSADLADGELTIDLTLPDEARLGSGGEVMALDALKQTMFQFEEVQSIELLIDGKQTDTLMGHVELEHPLTRN